MGIVLALSPALEARELPSLQKLNATIERVTFHDSGYVPGTRVTITVDAGRVRLSRRTRGEFKTDSLRVTFPSPAGCEWERQSLRVNGARARARLVLSFVLPMPQFRRSLLCEDFARRIRTHGIEMQGVTLGPREERWILTSEFRPSR